MSWEFVTYNTINDLVNSQEEAREIKYNQLMYLERLLATSSYNDDKREAMLRNAEQVDMMERLVLINKAKQNQLDPIRDMDNYSSTQAAKRAAARGGVH
tara:strand:- start:2936 stop:3232 length:297 start_codon:yes stop_codon:yes gene_type:complete